MMTFYDPCGHREGELAQIQEANERMAHHCEEESGLLRGESLCPLPPCPTWPPERKDVKQ